MFIDKIKNRIILFFFNLGRPSRLIHIPVNTYTCYSLTWMYHILLVHEEKIKGKEEDGDYYVFLIFFVTCYNECVFLLLSRISNKVKNVIVSTHSKRLA